MTSCYKDQAAPVDCATTVSYSNEIKPILSSSCANGLGPGTGCHDAWVLEYPGVLNAINIGTFESTIFDLQSMPKMPNDFGIDSLTNDELETIRCWLEQGYPNN
jgi:hypothetical protein